MEQKSFSFARKVAALMLSATAAGVFGFMFIASANNVTSSVVVGTAVPSISSFSVNSGGSITLVANNTQNVSVNATLSDSNGCAELTGGTTTILLYRSGITSSTCFGEGGAANPLNCYIASAFTASSTCSSGSQNTTTTFALQYFAQATDSSSSFPTNHWMATIIEKSSDNTTGTADSAGVTLNTLTAINVTTSSINYGTISASSTTGSTNQIATTTNAGNSSTTLQLLAQSTLTSGANSIPTSSQAYSTSTFTYPGTSTALTASAVTVAGLVFTAPTSTSNVQAPIFWGLTVPNGTSPGTYSGTNVFQAQFSP